MYFYDYRSLNEMLIEKVQQLDILEKEIVKMKLIILYSKSNFISRKMLASTFEEIEHLEQKVYKNLNEILIKIK